MRFGYVGIVLYLCICKTKTIINYAKKETGNTLETRGLTYSYTFLTKTKRSTYGRFASAKNAHLECKGTKLFPHNQISFC